MSTISVVSSGLHFDFGIRGLLAKLAERRRQREAFQAAYAELDLMNDAELKDLGMSRADFYVLASQAARKA